MVDEAVSFYRARFTVINNIPSTIEANYKGSMNIRIHFLISIALLVQILLLMSIT
ncbi:Uncharacterised protein [Avibacterium paragallinarum]|uniref:Uncharacterized protein n=1 Tax=Avibacterium paragallinarum TaxID=728 RepID=A0A380X7F1_AVIPA|nr:Uncharacterised protein [Avibacterium paragallinarum]